MGWVWRNRRGANNRAMTTPRAGERKAGHGSSKLERAMEGVVAREVKNLS